MDFSGPLPPLPISLHTVGPWSAEEDYGTGGATNSAFGVANWPSANMAIYVPMAIPWPFPVRRVFWGNGSSLGNMAFGIYTSGGTKIYASASTAQSGGSIPQYVTPSPDFILGPGAYYFALINDGTTSRVIGQTITAIDGRLRGLLQEAVGSMTLPNTMTPAQFAQTISPLCGVHRLASGF